jgi:leucyl/phenylalanyl-tRNA--protein transferase
LDVQWLTPHLASLGCVEVPRAEYLRRLTVALALPLPEAFVARYPEGDQRR